MDNAGGYTRANPLQKRDAKEMVEEFVKKMRWGPRETVLDVGCGPGDVTAEILCRELPGNASVLGVDLSLSMVQHAAAHYANERRSFMQLDISSKDVSDVVADLYSKLISLFCLHWVTDQRTTARNIYRLLEPGGETLLVLFARSPVFELYERMSRKAKWTPYMQDVHKFISPYQHEPDPRAAFHDLLVAEGLEVLHCSCRDREFVFGSMASLEESVKAVNPFLPRIPADQRPLFVAECMATAAGLCELREDKTVRTGYSLLVAHARKPWQKGADDAF